MYSLKIKVTKDILKKTKYCSGNLSENCAVTDAVRVVFPEAATGREYIYPFRVNWSKYEIRLPQSARKFIEKFDASNASGRVRMKELEFEIKISDEIIEKIDIDQIKKVLEDSKHLELIEQ